MSANMLLNYKKPNVVHSANNDLESLIYVLIWICILYAGLKILHQDKDTMETILKTWVLVSDLRSSSKPQKRPQLDWTNHRLQPDFGPVAFSFWKIKNWQKASCNWSKLQPVASKNIPPCRYHFPPFTIISPQI